MTIAINPDHLRERMREQLESATDEYCLSCSVQLTSADKEAGECTNCHASPLADDEDFLDGYYDAYEGSYDDEDDDGEE